MLITDDMIEAGAAVLAKLVARHDHNEWPTVRDYERNETRAILTAALAAAPKPSACPACHGTGTQPETNGER